MKNQRILICLLFIYFSLINHRTFSQDSNGLIWPQFRGINGSGIANPDQKPPVDLESSEKLLWKSPIISGASSPCIWDEKIFLTGFDKEKQQLQVLCINRLNGKLIWNRMVSVKEIEPYHRSASPADATPVTDGKRVYVHFGSFGLLCYDFEGNMIWTRELPINADKFGSGTSPILADNLLIHMVRRLSTNERYLLALDKCSGEIVWKRDLLEAGYSTPIMWYNNVIIHCEGFLAGYNLEDGIQNWHLLVRTHGESSPVVHENTLFVNTWHFLGDYDFMKDIPGKDEFLAKYDSNQDFLIDKQEFSGELFMAATSDNASSKITSDHGKIWDWFDMDKNAFFDSKELERYLNFFSSIDHGILAIRSGERGNIASSNLLWRETENVAEVPSPPYYKKRVYIVKNGGFFSCVDAQTGNLIYKHRIKGTGPYFASPIAANDRIYIAAHNGKVVILQAGDEFRIVTSTTFNEKILASPAIIDNKLYLRTEDHLYAFGD